VSFPLPAGVALVQVVGAGSVFEVALVERDGRRCICKRLKMRMLADPIGQCAMKREIEVLRRLRSGPVPRFIDSGEDDSGPWLLQDYVEALSMRQLVEAWHARGRGVPATLLDALVRDAFGGLAALHAASDGHGAFGLVHGDLGPDHMLLTRKSELRFVDFGLARWRDMDRSLCESGERGSLPYLAPELARGEQAPDQSCDVYALAATLAFVALGRAPCRQVGTPALLAEVAEQGVDVESLVRCERLSARARSALAKALSFARSERILRAAELLRLLD